MTKEEWVKFLRDIGRVFDEIEAALHRNHLSDGDVERMNGVLRDHELTKLRNVIDNWK